MDLLRIKLAVSPPQRFFLLAPLLFLSYSSMISAQFFGGGPQVPALFIFGDSLVDPGNNNVIKTLLRCDFAPYGQDFPGRNATGRFSNGKIPGDFLASALGIKDYLPPYYGAKLEEQDLLTGVSFASGGAGFDPNTCSFLSVIPVTKQLDLFNNYIKNITVIAGEETATNIITNSLYIICAGSDDIANNYYFPGSSTKDKFDVPSYVNFVIGSASDFLQSLIALGARRIGVVSAPPIGCVPTQRILHGGLLRSCADVQNDMALLFNSALSAELQRLQDSAPTGTLLVYIDFYNPALDLLTNPSKYGFDIATRSCCGTGTVEIAVLCNRLTPITCPDPSKYVFWDGFHPTEKAFETLMDVLVRDFVPKLLS